MIVDLIASAFFAVANFVIGLVPTVGMPSWLSATGTGTMGDLASQAGGFLGLIDNWVPVGEVLAAVPVALVMMTALISFKFALWVASWVRGGGGSK
jgi:hypothetical protein